MSDQFFKIIMNTAMELELRERLELALFRADRVEFILTEQ